MTGIVFNESSVIALAFFVFVIAGYRRIRGAVLIFLDDKINQTAKELEDAARLREEAQTYLRDAQHDLECAHKRASEIIADAQQNAKALLLSIDTRVQEIKARKEALLEARLKQQERRMVAELKGQAVTHAIQNVEEHLRTGITSKESLDLINRSFDKCIPLVSDDASSQ